MATTDNDAGLERRIHEIVAKLEAEGGKKMSDVRAILQAETGRSFEAPDQRARVKELVHIASARLAAAAAAEAEQSAEESEDESESEGESKPRMKAGTGAQGGKRGGKRKQVAAKRDGASSGALWESAPAPLLAKITSARAVLKRAGLGAKLATIKGVRTMAAEDVLARLHALLSAAGLSAKPSRQELADFKAKRALEKELDGIDTSNVLTDRRRRASAAAEEEAAFFGGGAQRSRLLRRVASPSDSADGDDNGGAAAAATRDTVDEANCDDADAEGEGGDGDGRAAEQPAKRLRRAVTESETESSSGESD